MHMVSALRIVPLDSRMLLAKLCGVVDGVQAEQAACFLWAAAFSVWRKFLLRTAGCIWDRWLCLQRGGPHLRQQGSEECEGSVWHETTWALGWLMGGNEEAGHSCLSLDTCWPVVDVLHSFSQKVGKLGKRKANFMLRSGKKLWSEREKILDFSGITWISCCNWVRSHNYFDEEGIERFL